jgi:isopentenyl diphosphate isomerase/L-lactate dehydrogenase-like FMN-dependent dehydrogenase
MRDIASKIQNVEDAEHFARRRLPRAVTHMIEEGAGQGITARENVEAFNEVGFQPRAATFFPNPDTRTTVQGLDVALPVVISSCGQIRMHHRSGEPAVARAAGAAGTIQVVSSLTGYPIEEVVRSATAPVFYQLYLPGGRENGEIMIERARQAGCAGLVVTVDVPSFARKDRSVRERVDDVPEKINLKLALRLFPQVATKPAWLFDYVRDGMRLETPMWLRPDGSPHTLWEAAASMLTSSPVWDDFGWIRDQWNGPLVVKGITSVEDARRSVDEGATGVVVSNHGGKALDGAPATLRVLPAIVDAVGDEIEVLMDGGIRRGADVVKAVALGARAVLIGRAYLWAHAAAGEAGVRRILEVFKEEIDRTLVLLGCPGLEALDESYVRLPPEWAPARLHDARDRTAP